MRRALVRTVMVAVGVASLCLYTVGASIAYLAIRAVWTDRTTTLIAVGAFVGVSVVLGYLTYRNGTRQVLSSIDAQPLDRARSPRFYAMFDRLLDRMDLAEPSVFVSDVGEPNAFAMTDSDGGVVVIDRSLVQVLTDDEVEAIVAHELAHLEHRDGLVQLAAFTGLQTVVQMVMVALLPLLLFVTGVAKADAWIRGRPRTWTTSLAWRARQVTLGLVLFVPSVVTVVLLAHSRRREFAADARAAEVTGKPLALARALARIDSIAEAELRLRAVVRGRPVGADGPSPLARLLSTHPATEERVTRLYRQATR